MPESPKWLLSQGSSRTGGDTVSSLHRLGVSKSPSHNSEASMNSNSSAVNAIYQNEMYPRVSSLLRTLRAPEHNIDKEIADILADAKAEAVNQVDGAEVTWAEVFAYKKGMIIGIGLMFFQVQYVRIVLHGRNIERLFFSRLTCFVFLFLLWFKHVMMFFIDAHVMPM